MLRLFLIVSGLLLAQTSPNQEKESTNSARALSVKDVIEMIQAKVPEDVVIGMIDKANLRVTLNAQEVVALTKAGASSRVLHELDSSIPAGGQLQSPQGARPATVSSDGTKQSLKAIDADSDDPESPHRPGLYLWDEDKNGQRRMLVIDKAVPQSSRQKMSGVLGWAIYAFLPRAHAPIRTKLTKPVFYFYVGETSKVDTVVDSPGQLALIKMDPQTMQGLAGRRLLYAKEPHLLAHPIIGTDPKAIRLFNSERMSPQIFRLTPETDLVPGEYCFFFNSEGSFAGKGSAAAITLWDFGVD
jgi:hypothetical protein